MNMAAGGANFFGNGGEKRDNVVANFGFNFRNAGRVKIGFAADGAPVLGGDFSGFRAGFADG